MVNFSNIFPSHKKTALPVDLKLSVHNCPSLRYILMLPTLFYMLCLESLTQVFVGRYKWVMLSCHTPRVRVLCIQQFHILRKILRIKAILRKILRTSMILRIRIFVNRKILILRIFLRKTTILRKILRIRLILRKRIFVNTGPGV